MDIYSKQGTKVSYIGCSDGQVNYGGHDDPRGILVEGAIYTVKRTVIHDWYTEVYLEEFPNMEFNSVCFDEVE